ncbi:MAG: M28 family peptidase [Saprospiraceae bacterium]
MHKLTYCLLAILLLSACKTVQDVALTQPTLTDKDLTEKTVDVNTIKGHIYYLASDEMAGRNTPSPELNIAGRYLATSLMRYGVKPVEGLGDYFQAVPMKKITPAQAGTISFGAEKLEIGKDFLCLKGGNLDTEAEVVFLDRGTAADFDKMDVTGKIVVVVAGLEGQDNPQQWFFSGADKLKIAKAKGAKALIELYSSVQLPWNYLVGFLNQPQTIVDDSAGESFPHIWLNASNAAAIAQLKGGNGLKAQVKIDGIKEEILKTYNVVGMVEGTDPILKDEYIIYSAHYDHVGIGRADERGDTIYNGARDNAVGSVTVLSAAENLAKYPTKRSAIFIFFTGEEKGLLGSAYYANHPAIPLEKVVYCFNSDNGGYNDTSRASIIGLTRTGAQPLIEQACTTFGLKAMEDAAPEQGLFDRSDNVNFAKKGVPAPTFSLGFTGFDEEITKYYHQPGDEPQTLDYDYLTKFFQSYVYSCRLIGNTDTSIFWNEGDKYYEAGKVLYNKE